MRFSVRTSLHLLTLTFLTLHVPACTTTSSTPSEEAISSSSSESKTLSDVEATTVEEPTAEENAALAAATGNDFNDPKDLELSDNKKADTTSAPVDYPTVDTPSAPESSPAVESMAKTEEAAPAPLADTGVESSGTLESESPVIADESSALSMSDAGSSQSDFGPILYGKNKTKVPKSYYKTLNEVAQILKKDHKKIVIVSGHADKHGSAVYNKKLAAKRAKAVKRYLTQHGVKAKQIRIESFGKNKLLSAGKGEAEQAQNRRVEIRLEAH